MFSVSSIQQLSDPLFIFTTLLGTKPLKYGKFTQHPKGLLKQLGLGRDYSSRSFRRDGVSFMLQIGIPSEMIKLMGDWRYDCYERYLDVSIPIRTQVMSTFVKNLPTSY